MPLNFNKASNCAGIPPALRPYQRDVISRIAAEINAGKRRALMVAPTGSGKTVIGAEIVADAVQAGARVLFLVHRRELVKQSSAKLHALGLDHGIVAAGFPARPNEPVQIASIQTLHARAVRSSRMELPTAEVIVVDEAHHASARTWTRLLAAYPEAIIIGLTATPCRADGHGLGGMFEALIECPQVADLIELGFLVPTRVYAPSAPDLTGVRIRAGDYVESQLAERMDVPKLVGDIVTHWHRLADRRCTVVFAVNVAHSVHLRNEFQRSGVVAEHLDGSTPSAERDAILARLAEGTTEVVCNVGVLTEGWDMPEIGCVIVGRPTKSFGLYRQMVGRGLRPADGKDHVLVLDHAGVTLVHGRVEERIDWALSPDSKAARTLQTSGGAHQPRELTVCPECAAVRWQGDPCTACGWQPSRPAFPVDVVDGDLVEVGCQPVEPDDAYKVAFYGQLVWIGRERGYQPGWAAHQFRQKYKHWPMTRYVEPLVPTPEVRSWVRSRQIAWARAREQDAVAPPT
jgi:DNA repair protein RadD